MLSVPFLCELSGKDDLSVSAWMDINFLITFDGSSNKTEKKRNGKRGSGEMGRRYVAFHSVFSSFLLLNDLEASPVSYTSLRSQGWKSICCWRACSNKTPVGHQVVCIVFKEILQLNFIARKLCSLCWTRVTPPPPPTSSVSVCHPYLVS